MTIQKEGAIIKKCNCNDESSDKLHGKGKRVANLCKKGEYSRCTTCGKEEKV